jgi:hypothetical protein
MVLLSLLPSRGKRVNQCWREMASSSTERTVEPRFTNLIRSWRPFITRNVRKPKLRLLSESYTATDALPPILPACCQPLLPACVFVTRDTVRHPRHFFFRKIYTWTDLFVMRGVRETSFHCIWFVLVTPCVSVKYLWKYGFAKYSDNLYAPCWLCFDSFFSERNVAAAGKGNMNPLNFICAFMRQMFSENILVTVGDRQFLLVPWHPTN